MKTHIARINKLNETIAAEEARIANALAQREKFRAAYDSAVQSADILRAKESRALALVAVGEADPAAAKTVSADVAAAEAKARSFQSTLTGLDEVEAAARVSIEDARQERGVAIRAALDEHFGALAPVYREAALALAALHRRMYALNNIRRSLGKPEDVYFSAFRSSHDADNLRLPALNHTCCQGDRAGPYADSLYDAHGEVFFPGEGLQRQALEAEIELLRKQGLEV